MSTIEEILAVKGRSVYAIAPHRTVYDAIVLMAEKEVGALLVMEGERLVGIISERDYARRVVLAGKSSRDTPVRDVMTKRVLCARGTQTVNECMALMTAKRARHLPVLDHKHVIGVVSIGDLVKATIREQQFVIEQLQHYISGS
ncbi:MAG: CBS domain-containing protein [Gammaproteobacteria bacterium]|nr:CBS domain-containing protein [Gammaproteobacteria bacterium]